MSIDIYCAAAVARSGEINQTGGCGVVLVAMDRFHRKQQREFSYGLGGSSLNLCEIQAVRLGLASVLPGHRATKVTIYVDSQDLASILTTNVAMMGYLSQIGDMRKWCNLYKDLSVHLLAVPNTYLDKAKKLAKIGCEEQKNRDSSTQLIE